MSSNETKKLEDQFLDMLKEFGQQTAADWKGGGKELAEYMAGRAEHLATTLAQIDPTNSDHVQQYGSAVKRERDAMALRAAQHVVWNADRHDDRLEDFVNGALNLVPQIIAKIAAKV